MLEVNNLSVSYGRHRALEDVSLRVNKGEICVILGANGAGKSTLLKSIAGMVRSERGAVVMNGKPITSMKAHRIVEEGIALVPEGRGIFGDLTVAENLQLGAFASRARKHEKVLLAEVYRLFPRLLERKGQIARTMSGGEQQMVAIGRALMSKPDILMLDEPSLGLSPLLSLELFRSLAEVAKTGVGILLVEQNARQSLKISDRGYLIENARVTGENTAAALMHDPAVVNAYLGGSRSEPQGNQAKTSSIRLPPSLRMPFGVEAMGRFWGELAARAGRIQLAFIRSVRREKGVPSAFVGRYDPKAGNDPWDDLAAAKSPMMSNMPQIADDALKLSQNCADYAKQAEMRLASHLNTERLTLTRPSGFSVLIKAAEAQTPVSHDIIEMDHQGSALLGHNSRFASDAEHETNNQWPVSDGISSLIANAVRTQTAFMEEQNKHLSSFTLSAEAVKDHANISDNCQNWPVTGSIATLVAQAAVRQSRYLTEEKSKEQSVKTKT